MNTALWHQELGVHRAYVLERKDEATGKYASVGNAISLANMLRDLTTLASVPGIYHVVSDGWVDGKRRIHVTLEVLEEGERLHE